MKHAPFFSQFLSDEVNINPTRLEILNKRVTTIDTYLSTHLDLFESTERQGSYALGTIIKPVNDNDEYDADMLVFLSYDAQLTPKSYISEVYRCFRSSKIYKPLAHRRTRCVELDYANDFHLDVVPCVTDHTGAHRICNRQTDEFELTDGTGYRNWFNEKNRKTNGHLKRVTRLLKYLRDHKRTFSVKSILLTTLVGRAVPDAYGSDLGFESLPDALVTTVQSMDIFLQSNPFLPRIDNPALPGEAFTRHWDQTKYSNFRAKIHSYAEKIKSAYDCPNHDESVRKWRDVFGSRFGQTRLEAQNESGVHVAAPVAGSVTVIPPKPYAR